MKFTSTDYLQSQKSILKFTDHYVAMAVMLDESAIGLSADGEGKKILKAGTIIGGAGSTNTLLGNTGALANKNNTQSGVTTVAHSAVDAEGVLLHDVDLTYGDAPATMLIHGFVNIDKLPEAPSADAIAALKSRILFMK